MTAAAITWFAVTTLALFVLTVFMPTPRNKRMGSAPGVARKSGERRRGVMDRIAGVVVMFLGRLTIALLHIFEYLGVDMSAFDEALARLTAFTSAQASSLRDANATLAAQHAEIDKLISDDAAQDQIDIADAVKAALDAAAAQLDAVTGALENPPVDTVPPVDQPPVDQPPVDTPPVDVPPVDTPPVDVPPVDTPPVEEPPVVTDPPAEVPPAEVPPVEPPVVVDPVPADPGADPVPAGDLPAETPVVEAPAGPIDTVPADAPVVPAGDLPVDAPVVEVTENPATGV